MGTHFKRTLRAAQLGDEDAFVVLFRDANPVVVRYLRAMGLGDPYDGASEGWIAAVRGLPDFSGDEIAWRVWLLACARQRAEERGARRAWSVVTGRTRGHTHRTDHGEGRLDLQELQASEGDGTAHRGLEHTMAALRRLPLGQGEVLVLRLGVGLPVGTVADVVGTDSVAVRRSESRALERLGAEAELVAWSLQAPATPRELADEGVAITAFRSSSVPDAEAGGATRVIALAPVAGGRRRSRRWMRQESGLDVTSRRARTRAATIVAAVVIWVLAIVLVLGAAAVAGVLPDQLQSALHDSLGLPAPHPDSPSPAPSPTKGNG